MRTNRSIVYFLIVLSLPLLGSTRTSIEAESIDYDGQKIRMAGAIKINHQFGDLSCCKGVIIMKGRSEPERIMLYGEVRAILRDGSVLTSDEADVNCETLEGVFTAESPNKVEYITRVEEDDKALPVKTMSRSMRVTMKKGERAEYEIADVQATGAVNIEYQQEE